MLSSPVAITAERARLRAAMQRHGLGAVLLSDPSSICYASGFAVPLPIGAGFCFAAGPCLAAVGVSGDAALLVSGSEASQARRETDLDNLIVYQSFGTFSPLDGRAAYLDAVGRLAAAVLPSQGPVSLGIEMRTVPAMVQHALQERFPSVQFVDAAPVLAASRMIKTPRELDLIRAAVRVADAGQEALLAARRPGVSEIELWNALCAAMQVAARQPVPLSGELISGPRTSAVDYPGGPLARRLELGDTIICDISPCVGGYYADCCNTLVVGDPTEDQVRYFRAARDAWEAAVEMLRPGRRASDAALAAEAAFARHGLPMAHYTGHSIGASVNETPRLVHYDHTPLAAGMVFAVEPGAYSGPEGTTGARTEKVILVTEQGPEVLSQFAWGLD